MPTKKPGRISEKDLLLPTLRVLAKQPGGACSTSKLIKLLEAEFQPDGEDAEILDNRDDTKFSQIVRNMVSHKDSANNIIHLGYVEHFKNGLKITEAGRSHLGKKGG